MIKAPQETRQIPVYMLVAAKDGIKLKNVDPEPGDNVRPVRSACGERNIC